MKKRVFRILLSLIMAIVLTLSATLPAWAFAITSTSSSDPGTENARISYENGILRIGLNPETLDRMLDDGKITKAELMEFLPEAIRDLIHDRDNITPGRKREKGEGIMNENVDSMMIRLVGLALAVLMMAGMTIYTGLFKKTSGMDARATVISVQDGHVAAEDVQWNA